MLQHLFIQNYAIIDRIEIAFSDRLNIITGETGAGKSILLGALQLIIGKRADTKVLYDKNKKCIVEAHFDITSLDLQTFFEEEDLDYDSLLVLRREIQRSGKSRAFVNDTPVTLSVLSALSIHLLDLHEQFDHLDIQKASFQLDVVDAIAQNMEERQAYAQKYDRYRAMGEQLETLVAAQNQALKEADFLRFQWNELEEANLQAGEKEALENERNRLLHAEDITQGMHEADQILDASETSIISRLADLRRQMERLADADKQLLGIADRLSAVVEELKDLHAEMVGVAENTALDDRRLEDVELRLDAIYRLENKHQVDGIEALIDLHSELSDQLAQNDDLNAKIKALQVRQTRAFESLQKMADVLRGARQQHIPDLQTQVQERLALLAMPHARLRIEQTPLDTLNATGGDRIHFTFSANKGHTLHALERVASGGEISRLNLCVKSIVAGALKVPTLIFDEIDAGVSGEVAHKMGGMLADLAAAHQVLVITHSPQIAAGADQHLYVYKREESDRTVADIRQLSEDERVVELAKMISGDTPSEAALRNAAELIAAAAQREP